MKSQTELDNHSNQLNPNNEEYYKSRGISDPSDDYDDDDDYDVKPDEEIEEGDPWPWYGED